MLEKLVVQTLFPKTNRHKTQQVVLKNNAECRIEIETKHNTKRKNNEES